jgi:carbon monoxide dehydrogenase subunit G
MFSHHVETSIDIHATPEAAWDMLTDFQAYDDWNPMLRKVRTQTQVGNPVSFEVLVGRSKRMKLKAKMT